MNKGTKQPSHEIPLMLLNNDLERILGALYNLREANNREWFSTLDISNYLMSEAGINVHWRTVDKLFGNNKEFINRRKRSKRWHYFLLTAGEDLVAQKSSRIRVVRPELAVAATIDLHDLLSSLTGDVRLCDPYVDAKTLEHLDACTSASQIQLLTMNFKDSGKLRRLYQAFTTKGVPFEIRIVSKQDIHDRYIIDDQLMYLLGTSLNGFAKKQSFIVEAGEDIRTSIIKEFNSRWTQSKPI